MKVREIAKAMDVPRLSRRDLEQAGDLGQPSRGELSDLLCSGCRDQARSSVRIPQARKHRRRHIDAGDPRESARQPGTALTSRIVSRPRSRSSTRSTPATSAPMAPAAASASCSGLEVDRQRLGPAAQRDVGAPLPRGSKPAHRSQNVPPQDEDPQVVAGMANRLLKIEHRTQPLERVQAFARRARGRSPGPAPAPRSRRAA